MERLIGFSPIILSVLLSIIVCILIRKNKKVFLASLIILTLVNIAIGLYIFEKPIFSLIGDEKIEVAVKTNFSDPGFNATLHGKDIKEKVLVNSEVDINKIGEYNITYKLEYLLGEKILSRKVLVTDKEKPEIILNGDIDYIMYSNAKYNEPGYSAKDNYDGDITNKVTVAKEEISDKKYKIIYTVNDSSGNQTICERTVTLIEPPKVNPSKNGVIYLTFDDGPSANTTPKILDILKKQNVKATFFILNYSSANEHLIKRIVDEGHSIGIHGYSHNYKEIYTSEQTYIENLNKLQEKIKKTTGVTTNITRFPGGSSNTVSKFNKGIMTRLTKLVEAKGYKYYDWNIESGDSGGAKTKEDVYNNVIKYLSKKRANVVLMHDFSSNNKTINALNDIINYGKNNGYTFEAINDETPTIHHRVNN